jgi:hypothetical protein
MYQGTLPDLSDLLLREEVGVLLVRRRHEGGFCPQLGRQVTKGATQGEKDGHDVVTHGTGVTLGARVAIQDTSHVHELLAGRRGNQAGTAGGRDQTNTDGTALSGDLAGNSVGKTVLTSPVTTTDGSDVQLGRGNGTTDRVSDFGRALNSHTNVSVRVTDSNKGLETSTLTSRRLLLDGHDLWEDNGSKREKTRQAIHQPQ